MTVQTKLLRLSKKRLAGKLTITSGNYDITAVQYESVRSVFGIIRKPIETKIQVKSNSASVNAPLYVPV